MRYQLRLIILLIIPVISSVRVNAQDPTQSTNVFHQLKEQGLTFGINETLEGYNNFRGGIRTGTAYASTFDANVNFDLQKVIGLKGGSLYADFEYHSGDNPSDKLTGDFQVFDKHNSFPFAQILEFWYQQKLFNNELRIKVGKIDANTEFSVIDNGLDFINSSTQVTPTFFVFPTFPDPVPSINIFFSPNKLVYTNLAIDEANQKGDLFNFYGDPVSIQPTTNGILILSESGLTWDHLFNKGQDGNLKFGIWTHTGTFPRFNNKNQQSAQGLYLIFDQTLWQPKQNTPTDRGIRMFLEYGLTDSAVAPIYAHYGGGLVWTGMSKSRLNDAIGISSQYVSLSPGLHLQKLYELNMEAFYKFTITPWLFVKADMQYIINPGGNLDNAIVGIMLLNFNMGT